MSDTKIINMNHMDMPINTVNNLKKYTVIDFEYTEAMRKGKKEQCICNIAAIFIEEGKVTDTLNEWTVPMNVTPTGLTGLHTKLKLINHHLANKEMKATKESYQEFFRRSFSWLSRYKIITNPIIGWGVNNDVATYNNLVDDLFKDEPLESKVVPIVIQDAQVGFSDMLGRQGLALSNMCNFMDVEYKADHIGLSDTRRINNVLAKYRNKILK